MNLNNQVQILSDSNDLIEFSLAPHETIYRLVLEELSSGETIILGSVPEEDQVLIKKEFALNTVIFYIKNFEVIAAILSHNANFSTGKTSFEFECESYLEGIILNQTSDVSVSVLSQTGGHLFTLDDIAAFESPQSVYPLDLKMTDVESRYVLAGKIAYGQFNRFLIYDLFRKEIIVQPIHFKILCNKAGLELKLSGPELLEISLGEDHAVADPNKITGKGKRIFESYQLEDHRNKHLLAIVLFNDIRYYIHNKKTGIYLTKGNALSVCGYQSRMRTTFGSENLYIYGRSTHYSYNASRDYDLLYIDGREDPVTVFKRPLKTRFFRRFGFFKIPISAFDGADQQPKVLYLGDEELVLHRFKLEMSPKKERIAKFKRKNGQVLLLAVSKRGNISLRKSLQPKEFTVKNRVLNRLNELKKSKRMLQLFKLIFLLVGRLPKKQKLVVFESFHAKQYSDSPRAIYEYMKEHHPDYQLLWSVDKTAENLFREFEVPSIRRFTLRWFFNFPRAEYWVNNVRLPLWMPKPKGTKYIQTWHGTPLKRLGTDIEEIHMPGTNTSAYKKNFVTEAKKWDYLVSPNLYSTKIFRRAFRYRGEVIESGYPRNDVLTNYDEKLVHKLKKKLGLPEDKKIMLYAPTWRDNEFYEKGKYKFEFQFDLDRWKEEFGHEWILLSRMHYLVAESFDFSACEGTVFDASSYPDIRDLYLISDLMITDYSSVFFDYAVLDRPIIFFMYDLGQYRDQLRGFYIDIEEEAPGPIAETEEELFSAIKEVKDSDVLLDPKFRAFKEKFSSLEDGRATARAVSAMLGNPETQDRAENKMDQEDIKKMV